MHKVVLALLLGLILTISSAMAENTIAFDCRTTKALDDDNIHLFRFELKNISDAKLIDYVWPEEDGDPLAVRTKPKHSSLALLNENARITLMNDRIELFGDGDGIQLVYVNLYKKTRYRTGYVRVVNHDGGDSKGVYSPVVCRNKEI